MIFTPFVVDMLKSKFRKIKLNNFLNLELSLNDIIK